MLISFDSLKKVLTEKSSTNDVYPRRRKAKNTITTESLVQKILEEEIGNHHHHHSPDKRGSTINKDIDNKGIKDSNRHSRGSTLVYTQPITVVIKPQIISKSIHSKTGDFFLPTIYHSLKEDIAYCEKNYILLKQILLYIGKELKTQFQIYSENTSYEFNENTYMTYLESIPIDIDTIYIEYWLQYALTSPPNTITNNTNNSISFHQNRIHNADTMSSDTTTTTTTNNNSNNNDSNVISTNSSPSKKKNKKKSRDIATANSDMDEYDGGDFEYDEDNNNTYNNNEGDNIQNGYVVINQDITTDTRHTTTTMTTSSSPEKVKEQSIIYTSSIQKFQRFLIQLLCYIRYHLLCGVLLEKKGFIRQFYLKDFMNMLKSQWSNTPRVNRKVIKNGNINYNEIMDNIHKLQSSPEPTDTNMTDTSASSNYNHNDKEYKLNKQENNNIGNPENNSITNILYGLKPLSPGRESNAPTNTTTTTASGKPLHREKEIEDHHAFLFTLASPETILSDYPFLAATTKKRTKNTSYNATMMKKQKPAFNYPPYNSISNTLENNSIHEENSLKMASIIQRCNSQPLPETTSSSILYTQDSLYSAHSTHSSNNTSQSKRRFIQEEELPPLKGTTPIQYENLKSKHMRNLSSTNKALNNTTTLRGTKSTNTLLTRKKKSQRNTVPHAISYTNNDQLNYISEGSNNSIYHTYDDVVDNVKILKKELHQTKKQLTVINNWVDDSISWVNTHADPVIKTTGLSCRSIEKCKEMAVESLYMTLSRHLSKVLVFRWVHWKQVILEMKLKDISLIYCRIKSINVMINTLKRIHYRQLLKGFLPWYNQVQEELWQKRNQATTIITSVVRGYLTRQQLKHDKESTAVVKIQAHIRSHLAIEHYQNIKKFNRENPAALKIQHCVRTFVRKRRAKHKRDHNLQKKAVIKIQKHIRGVLGRKLYQEVKCKHETDLIELKKLNKMKLKIKKQIEIQRQLDQERLIKRGTMKKMEEIEKLKKLEESKQRDKVRNQKLLEMKMKRDVERQEQLLKEQAELKEQEELEKESQEQVVVEVRASKRKNRPKSENKKNTVKINETNITSLNLIAPSTPDMSDTNDTSTRSDIVMDTDITSDLPITSRGELSSRSKSTHIFADVKELHLFDTIPSEKHLFDKDSPHVFATPRDEVKHVYTVRSARTLHSARSMDSIDEHDLDREDTTNSNSHSDSNTASTDSSKSNSSDSGDDVNIETTATKSQENESEENHNTGAGNNNTTTTAAAAAAAANGDDDRVHTTIREEMDVEVSLTTTVKNKDDGKKNEDVENMLEDNQDDVKNEIFDDHEMGDDDVHVDRVDTIKDEILHEQPDQDLQNDQIAHMDSKEEDLIPPLLNIMSPDNTVHTARSEISVMSTAPVSTARTARDMKEGNNHQIVKTTARSHITTTTTNTTMKLTARETVIDKKDLTLPNTARDQPNSVRKNDNTTTTNKDTARSMRSKTPINTSRATTKTSRPSSSTASIGATVTTTTTSSQNHNKPMNSARNSTDKIITSARNINRPSSQETPRSQRTVTSKRITTAASISEQTEKEDDVQQSIDTTMTAIHHEVVITKTIAEEAADNTDADGDITLNQEESNEKESLAVDTIMNSSSTNILKEIHDKDFITTGLTSYPDKSNPKSISDVLKDGNSAERDDDGITETAQESSTDSIDKLKSEDDVSLLTNIVDNVSDKNESDDQVSDMNQIHESIIQQQQHMTEMMIIEGNQVKDAVVDSIQSSDRMNKVQVDKTADIVETTATSSRPSSAAATDAAVSTRKTSTSSIQRSSSRDNTTIHRSGNQSVRSNSHNEPLSSSHIRPTSRENTSRSTMTSARPGSRGESSTVVSTRRVSKNSSMMPDTTIDKSNSRPSSSSTGNRQINKSNSRPASRGEIVSTNTSIRKQSRSDGVRSSSATSGSTSKRISSITNTSNVIENINDKQLDSDTQNDITVDHVADNTDIEKSSLNDADDDDNDDEKESIVDNDNDNDEDILYTDNTVDTEGNRDTMTKVDDKKDTFNMKSLADSLTGTDQETINTKEIQSTSTDTNANTTVPTSVDDITMVSLPATTNTTIANTDLEEKLKRLEEIERSIKEKEMYMIEMARQAEEKHAAMTKALEDIEIKRKQQILDMELEQAKKQVNQPTNTDTIMKSNSNNPMYQSIPNHMRTNEKFLPPSTATRKIYKNEEWCQLYDDGNKAYYWYNMNTQAVQWDEPGIEHEWEHSQNVPDTDSGYESGGALTDYSTENYESGGDYSDSEYDHEEDRETWHEYWDEQAQAKYWYNSVTGEATWTRPDNYSTLGSNAGGGGNGTDYDDTSVISTSTAGGGGDGGNVDNATSSPNDWISYLDDATGQEYWYNVKTGQTSWA